MRVLLALIVVVAVAAATLEVRPLDAKEMEARKAAVMASSDFGGQMRTLQRDSFAKYGALKRQMNQRSLEAEKRGEDAAAARKLLLTECSDVLDEDNNALSWVDLFPEACSSCGLIEAIGNFPELSCPESPATTTDLPIGSCCNDDTNCASGLVCDKINAVCTSSCDTYDDCEEGSWNSEMSCENTALKSSDSLDEDLADECTFCNYAYQCSDFASFCGICTDYVGPVNLTTVVEAGCEYVADDVDDWNVDVLDATCTEACAYDCLAEFMETTETVYQCLDYECGIQGMTKEEAIQGMESACYTYNDEYCMILLFGGGVTDDCTEAGCCWYSLYGPFAGFFCEDAPMEVCPNNLSAGFATTPTALAVAISTVLAAVFVRL